ncbi:MAG: diaminopimelate epimerase [Cyclobacteriaceae bacterium]|nr:diaminopimelate epimerase [Cyclobacteriaceae bacterium]
MSSLAFFKYQGTGNDFIMIDDREETFELANHSFIAQLCHRRFGIGADGLILLRNHSEADFEMIYYNADGYLTTLCGNGSRCAVQFASHLGLVSTSCRFMTVQGILGATLGDGLVEINMPDVQAIENHPDHFFLNTGSPHHVCYVNDVKNYDVFNLGRKIRNGAPYFKEGSNVNFVEILDFNHIFVRTYERGVEDETLSCGTGVTAAALTLSLKGGASPIFVQTPGGNLSISFEKDTNGGFKNVRLKGPAERVFEGLWNF